MFKRTMNFLNKHRIIYDNQYGFRHNHCTYMALLETMDHVSDALDKKHNRGHVHRPVQGIRYCRSYHIVK